MNGEHIPVLTNGIDPEKVFYFQQPHYGIIYSVVDGKVVVEHNNIDSLKKYSLVVADLSSEHWGHPTIDMVYDLLEEHNIQFIVLTHLLEDHLTRPKLFFYPHWYYQSVQKQLEKYKPTVSYDKCKYKLSCLNRSAKTHRIYNWLLLRKKSYFQDSLITIHHDIDIPQNWNRPDDPVLLQADTDEWNKLKINLVDVYKWIPTPESIFDATHPAYTDSYLHLVTESTMLPGQFVTEKTWKTVVAGQLFLMIGGQHTVSYLRNCGVDVFDDIIDHKYYDNEPDWEVRISRAHSIIDELVTQDLSKIYQETFTRRLLNQTKYLNGEFGEPYRSLVIQHIPQ